MDIANYFLSPILCFLICPVLWPLPTHLLHRLLLLYLSSKFWSSPWLSPGPSAFLTSYHLPTGSHLIPRIRIPSVWHQQPTWHILLNVSKAFQLRCPHLLLFQWPRHHTRSLRSRCSCQGHDWCFLQSRLPMLSSTECTDNTRSLNSDHRSHPHRH